MRFADAEAVREAWTKSQISVLDYVTNIRPFLGHETIDDIFKQMPPRVRDMFERFAISWVAPGEVVTVGRGESLPDPEDLVEVLGAWLERRAGTLQTKWGSAPAYRALNGGQAVAAYHG